MSYPISTPVTFDGFGSPGAEIDFDANVVDNKILNFVATTAGDLLFRQAAAPNYLDRLPIGVAGTVLQSVAGLPAWVDVITPLSQGIFTATVTASTLGIPTSRTGGASPGTWFPLSGVTPYVTWIAPVNLDGFFSTTVGATYGQYIVPIGASGTYTLSAQICFDSGVGVNAGVGLPVIPTGTAVRQARIFNATTPVALGVSSVQNAGSNNNQTVVWVVAENVVLAAGDHIEIQVRHDRSAANTVTIGATSVDFQTYFSGKRVK
jgi:hypothetical protein